MGNERKRVFKGAFVIGFSFDRIRRRLSFFVQCAEGVTLQNTRKGIEDKKATDGEILIKADDLSDRA